ncbi:MAG TPA: quinolinate synthase NadA [Thermoplasmatales archaeon]|nr:quinolinate synthase NadA [Thermoplasmatales archaeon]
MEKKLLEKIMKLKETKNVTILAHNYQLPEIQDVADFVGDSLDLAQKATKTPSKYIIFCGVNFMAESAKILNPDKVVIHPVPESRCPMADMVDVESLGWLQKDHPGAVTVAYVNTTADVKAISDVCCTSSNAVKVIKNLDAKKIIFIPDKNLGLYVKRFIKDKEIILWPGMCPTHHNSIKKEDILKLKKLHPDAEVMVHPECQPEVIDIADHVFSTNGMVKHAAQSKNREFIVGTEKELCYRLKKENPNKEFYPLPNAVCPNMKKITIDKVIHSLETLGPRLELPPEIIEKARKPLTRMMEIGRGD